MSGKFSTPVARCKKLRKFWVDGGYSGRLLDWVAERFKFYLAVVLRPKQTKQFLLLPRLWMVERTFGWLNHARRLSKSYERLTCTNFIGYRGENGGHHLLPLFINL
jgi:putative transposase